jgi:hypothetical protein
MDWSRIEQQVQYQTQSSFGQGQQPYRRSTSGLSLSRGNSVERIRQNSDSRDRDYRSRDDYPEMSRDDYRDGGQEDFRNVPTSDFPLLTDKSHASAISYDEMLREITQLKHAFTQQQTKISTLELKVTSLSKASESSQQTNTDRFSSLEVTLGSVTRQRGHDGPSAETGNLLRSVTSRIDGLDAGV